MNYFDVVLVIAFSTSLFYLYWLFDMYKIINNLGERNIKIAVSTEINGTNHLRTADFEPWISVYQNKVGGRILLAVYPFCGRCAVWCVLQPLFFNCLDRGISWSVLRALYRKSGHTGNAALTAPRLWCEIRTQTSRSVGMRIFPVP